MVDLYVQTRETIEKQGNGMGRRTISTTLDDQDYFYVKEHGLMFSQLLHDKIKEMQNITDGTTLQEKEDFEKIIERRDTKITELLSNFQKAVNYLNEKNMIDDFLQKNKL